MLEALYQIGKTQEVDILDTLVKSIDESYRYVIKIQFKLNDGKFEFYQIDFEESSSEKKRAYLLMDTAGSGAARTPCAPITDITKTFSKKILKSVDRFIADFEPTGENRKLLVSLSECLNANSDKITKELMRFVNRSPDLIAREYGTLLLLTVVRNEREEIYPGDFDPLIRTLRDKGKRSFTSYYDKNKIKSVGIGEKFCYFCNRKVSEVWGYASPFAFYTVDKVSFVTGGFNPANAWKNYPVCPDCAVTLHIGKNYAEKNLSFSFAGFSYLLLPQLVIFDNDKMKDILKRLKIYADFGLGEKENAAARIERTEMKLLDMLSNNDNVVNFNFLFYEKSNSEFKILLLLQEIPPSRLKLIIDTKNRVDMSYKDIFVINSKNGLFYLDFNFSFIGEFFKGRKKDLDFKKSFMTVLRNIFYLKPISFSLLLDRFMSKIRITFANDGEEKIYQVTLIAFKSLLFLEELKILSRRRYEMTGNVNMPFDEFFRRFKIFDDYVKRALFLEGTLAGKLLSVQYSDKNSKPFYSRLNGLKIDEKVAKRLLPEMINKLEEYDKNFKSFKDIEEAISFYFLNSDFSNYSVDELSFYFSMGLSLHSFLDQSENNDKPEREEANA